MIIPTLTISIWETFFQYFLVIVKHSQLLENIEKMFPWYNMHCYMFSTFKSSITHCVCNQSRNGQAFSTGNTPSCSSDKNISSSEIAYEHISLCMDIVHHILAKLLYFFDHFFSQKMFQTLSVALADSVNFSISQ